MVSCRRWFLLAVMCLTTDLVSSFCTSHPQCSNCLINSFKCDNETFGPSLDQTVFPEHKYRSLHSLKLNNTKIVYFGVGVFEYMQNLLDLSVAHNSIFEIKRTDFQNLTSLTNLDLSYNKIKSIEENSFNNLLKLGILDLSFNQISSLANGSLFTNLKELRFLGLSANKIVILPDGIFVSQSKLISFYIRGNLISTLSVKVLEPLLSLKNLSFQGNPLLCDCNLKSVLSWCEERKLEVRAVCRNRVTGERVPIVTVKNLTECNEVSTKEDKEDNMDTHVEVNIILSILLVICIISICGYMVFRFLKKRSILNYTTSSAMNFSDAVENEDDTYEYIPPPLSLQQNENNYVHPQLPNRTAYNAGTVEENELYEGSESDLDLTKFCKTRSQNSYNLQKSSDKTNKVTDTGINKLEGFLDFVVSVENK